MRRVPITRTVAVAVLAAALVATAGPAQAHNYLVASTPEAGSTITTLPEQFVVTTNEPLLTLEGNTGGFALAVQDESGRYYGDGCLTVEGSSVSTPASLGEAGEYTLAWQVVSGDGHTVSDRFTFQWDPAAGEPVTDGTDSAPTCGGTASAPDHASPENSAAAGSDLSTVLWIGGALLAVALAGGVTIFAGRSKRDGGEAS